MALRRGLAFGIQSARALCDRTSYIHVMGDGDDTKKNATDVVVLGPPTPDGEGVRVLRAREERIEAGELRALKEGKPITGEVVSLEPRKENPRVCDVRSSYAPPSSAAPKKGPAQVASDKYRENWDQVFSSREPRDRSLN